MNYKLNMYTIRIPLIHNRNEVFQEAPALSCDYALSSTISGSFSCLFINSTYEIKYLISQEENQTFLTLFDIIALDRNMAVNIVKDAVKQICIELTYLFIFDGTNLHSLQPRIEADWNNINIAINEYKFDNTSMEANSLPSFGSLELIHLEDSVSILLKTIIDIDSFDLNKQKNEGYSFIMQEFYYSLGIENVKSKFFHLYSILEFCSEKYKAQSLANPLFSKAEKEKILEFISTEFVDGKEKSKRLKESNDLNRLTDLGRASSIVNILKWMGISSFKYKGEIININKRIFSELSEQRNQLIHVRKDDSLKHTLEEYVGWLLCIDLNIVKFIRMNI